MEAYAAVGEAETCFFCTLDEIGVGGIYPEFDKARGKSSHSITEKGVVGFVACFGKGDNIENLVNRLLGFEGFFGEAILLEGEKSLWAIVWAVAETEEASLGELVFPFFDEVGAKVCCLDVGVFEKGEGTRE